MSCPPGHIMRAAYTTKKGVHVKRTCIKDQGKPGKGPKILPAPKEHGLLRSYGYSTHSTDRSRHIALSKASHNDPDKTLKVLRHLNLLANYQANPQIKQTMQKDVKYLSQKHKSSKGGSRKSSRKSSRKTSRRTSKKSSGW